MAELPVLKNWNALVEEQLNITGHGEKNILKIIHMCQAFTAEIQPVSQWLGQQQSYVARIYNIFNEMYVTRFGESPPPRPQDTPVTEVLLDTPERRKQAIREVALSLTKPGDDVSDEAVFEELRLRGMKIDASNPTAIISTILRGFKPYFEKIKGKRGVFRRQQ